MRYCEGLPSQGNRALTTEERGRVARAGRAAWARFAVRVASIPAALSAGTALAVALAPSVGDRRAAALVAITFLLAVPWGLLWARDGFRDARALGRDLSRGEVEVFSAGPRTVAVLPASARILAGREPPLARRGVVGEVAPPAHDAPGWAVPLSEIPERLQHLAWERRAMAVAEREEIERRVADLKRPPILLAALTALAAGGILATAENGERSPAAAALRVVVWVAVLGLAWARVWKARSLGARLEADARDGWVARATRGEAAGAEVLPASGMPWSEHGSPSAWRVAASAGRLWWRPR